MNKEEFLKRIKKTAKGIDNTAEIYLFGSRAKDDFGNDSDGIL